MSSLIARLTSKGQVTLPREILDALGVKPGDYITLTSTPEGVLISATNGSDRQQDEGEAAYIQLVRAISAELEAEGITEEEQLDEAIKQAKREAFEERYGHLRL